MIRNPYKPLEKALGYGFRRRSRLEHALTHPSYSHERPEEIPDNQRLEFLGDAALGLVAAEAVFEHVPGGTEGELTRLRSLLTSTKALADVAARLQLGDYLRLGRGEMLSGGRTRPSTLADAMEAVIGAAFVDGGLKAVQKIFARVFLPELHHIRSAHRIENPKGLLQEKAQAAGRGNPKYFVVQEEGLPHQRWYTVEARVRDEVVGVGRGPNKRDAETEAALAALDAWPES